jgi:magnesium-transporting ATPase (P-type)
MMISNLFPFLRQLSYYYTYVLKQMNNLDDLTISYQNRIKNKLNLLISWNEILVYLAFNAIVYHIYGQVISKWLLHWIFSFFQNTFIGGSKLTGTFEDEEGKEESTGEEAEEENVKDVHYWQIWFFTYSMFLLYLTCLLYIFQKKWKFARRLVHVSDVLPFLSFPFPCFP